MKHLLMSHQLHNSTEHVRREKRRNAEPHAQHGEAGKQGEETRASATTTLTGDVCDLK